jgi:Ycf66 protein N-terminus
MLANLLALIVGGGSLALYLAPFFLPEVGRKNDVVWAGVGLFYALVLWACAGRITGGVLLGQMASVSLLGWLGWQTLLYRRQATPLDQQTPVENFDKLTESLSGKLEELKQSDTVAKISPQVTQLLDKAKAAGQSVAESVSEAAQSTAGDTGTDAQSSASPSAASSASPSVSELTAKAKGIATGLGGIATDLLKGVGAKASSPADAGPATTSTSKSASSNKSVYVRKQYRDAEPTPAQSKAQPETPVKAPPESAPPAELETQPVAESAADRPTAAKPAPTSEPQAVLETPSSPQAAAAQAADPPTQPEPTSSAAPELPSEDESEA